MENENLNEAEKPALNKTDVSGQSELLKAFAKHYNEQHYEEISEDFIDEYIKSL